MAQKTTEQILNELFSKINNVIAPADFSGGAQSRQFVALMFPGLTVSPKDYDITTFDGRKNLYRLADQLPAVNKSYLDSGRKCSDMYFKMLSAQVSEDNSAQAKALEAAYKKAQAYLATPAYKEYKVYRDEYNDAHDDYLSILNDPDLSDREREKALRSAKRAMQEAEDDWNALGHKREVEDALATSQRYLAFTPKSFFANAGRIFEAAKDPENDFYPAVCLPSEWAVNPDALSWTRVVLKQGSSESKLQEDVKQIDSDFSASFSSGLWHAEGSGGYHDRMEQLNKSATVDKLGISFEIARVNISRDWFTSALLGYDATIPGMKKGGLCAGSLDKAAQCEFPFLPTAFIIARNINVYNQFSQEEENFLKEVQSWSASAHVGYGPFSVGNDTSSSHDLTSQEKKEFGNAVKMSVGKGVQIIAFLNTILTPAFPSKDSDRAALDRLTDLGDFLLRADH